MTTKSPFKGSVLAWDVAGGTTYADMADLFGFMPPSIKRGIGESTVSNSPNDYRVFDVPGFMDSGELDAKVRFVGSAYATLRTAFEATVLITWKFSFAKLLGETNAATLTGAGLISELSIPERGVKDDDPWEVNFKIRTSGKWTFTASS